MANIKESDLPLAASVTDSDYVRIVTSGGASERASFTSFAPPIVKEFTSATVTINAGAAAGASISFTAPTGYKTLCPVYSRTNGDVFANYPAALTQGLTSGTTTVYIRNTASSAVSVSATIGIMFVKA